MDKAIGFGAVMIFGMLAACGSSGSDGAAISDAGGVANYDASALMPVTLPDGAAVDVAEDAAAADDAMAEDGGSVSTPTPDGEAPPSDDAAAPTEDSGIGPDDASLPPADASTRMEVHCAVTDFATKKVTVYVGCNGEQDPSGAVITWMDATGVTDQCTSANATAVNAKANCATGTVCAVHTPSFDGNGTCQ